MTVEPTTISPPVRTRARRVGFHLGTEIPPDDLVALATECERSGFQEALVGEDVPFTGGISAMTALVAATDDIPINLGIVSALLRQPTVLAMEVATIARMYPGRDVRLGIASGVPRWLKQLDVMPRSPLTAVRECVTAVRSLLAGEALNVTGEVFTFRDVQLAHPPKEPLPIFMGPIGPKMLRLSGEIADGSYLGVCSSPEYIAWALERIAEGAEIGGRSQLPHETVTLALFSTDEDRDVAIAHGRRSAAWWIAAMGPNAYTDAVGVSDDVRRILADNPGADVTSLGRLIENTLSDDVVQRLTVSGTYADCAAAIGRLHDAGTDSVVLFPVPEDRSAQMLRRGAQHVLPLLADVADEKTDDASRVHA